MLAQLQLQLQLQLKAEFTLFPFNPTSHPATHPPGKVEKLNTNLKKDHRNYDFIFVYIDFDNFNFDDFNFDDFNFNDFNFDNSILMISTLMTSIVMTSIF